MVCDITRNSIVSVHLDDVGRCWGQPGNGWQIQWGPALLLTSHIALFFQYIKLLFLTSVFSIAELVSSGYPVKRKIIPQAGELPMRTIPLALLTQFEVILRERAVPNNAHGPYKKWLRYYLAFCQKYRLAESKPESLDEFLHKSEVKRQTMAQRQEASRAVTLYSELMPSTASHDELGSPQNVMLPGKAPDEPRPASPSFPNRLVRPVELASKRQTPNSPPVPPTQSRKVTTKEAKSPLDL